MQVIVTRELGLRMSCDRQRAGVSVLSVAIVICVAAALCFAGWFALKGDRDAQPQPEPVRPYAQPKASGVSQNNASEETSTATTSSSAGRLDAGHPISETRSSPQESQLQAILDRLSAVRQSKKGSLAEYAQLLRSIAAIGSDEAAEALATLMTDETFQFPGRALLFAEAVESMRDERIAAAARRVLEHDVGEGLSTWSDVDGYVDILARNGRPDDIAYLAGLLRELPANQLAFSIVDNLRHVPGSTWSREFADLAFNTDQKVAVALLKSIGRREEPEAQQALWDVSMRATDRPDLRIGALCALGETATEQAIPSVLVSFDECVAGGGRADAMAILHAVAANQNIPPKERAELLSPRIRDALASDDPVSVREGVQLLANEPSLVTPDLLARLREICDANEGEVTDIARRAIAAAGRRDNS